MIGDYRNAGREWEPKGEPARVQGHDFPDQQLGKVAPYGVYDLSANTGWVNVGTDHDTAAFAVESLRSWWNGTGRDEYRAATRLLITADAGGSNGYRTRAWKTELAALAAETGLTITVCHFPPGTSKWNAIEHRLFSHITMNWRGRPLTSHEVVVGTIAATTTRTGLSVRAQLDTNNYPKGVAIGDEQMASLAITRHDWHGEWNYTLHRDQPDFTPAPPPPSPETDRTGLAHPAVTGMSPTAFDTLITRLLTPHDTQREAALHSRRGGHRHTAKGPGRRPTLTLADRVVLTLIHDRFRLPVKDLTKLFDIGQTTANKVIRDTRQLLNQLDHTIDPAEPLTTLAEFTAYITTAGITPTHPNETPIN